MNNNGFHRVKKLDIVPNRHTNGNTTLIITQDICGTDRNGEYNQVETQVELVLFHTGLPDGFKIVDHDARRCAREFLGI